MKLKRIKSFLLMILGIGLLVACGHPETIDVISREAGSGTRDAFVEIVGLEDEHGDDLTTLDAVVQNSTGSVMQTVSNDPAAIGYASIGSLNSTVKTVAVDGFEPTPEHISEGKYTIARPFNVAWAKDSLTENAKDFLRFIHSKEGQAVVEEEGFIKVNIHDKEELPAYQSNEKLTGSIEVVGSTSVTPVMERLYEAYKEYQPKVSVNITSNGSSAGMSSAINNVADLAMASRSLTEEEQKELDYEAIALDGIVLIVSPESKISNLTMEQVRGIFSGEITSWDEIK